MIRSMRHKGLRRLHEDDNPRGVNCGACRKTARHSRCNSAPSDAPAENGHRIPSADTAGSAQTALDLSAPVGFFGVLGYLDFADNLKDLGWGSWERSLPDSSSLGGDSHSSPRRFSS